MRSRDLPIEDAGPSIGLYEALMLGDDERGAAAHRSARPWQKGPERRDRAALRADVGWLRERLILRGVDVAAKDKYGRMLASRRARTRRTLTRCCCLAQARRDRVGPRRWRDWGKLAILQKDTGKEKAAPDLAEGSHRGRSESRSCAG